jgi:hypothetical protein
MSGEQLVGVGDLFELEAVCEQGREVQPFVKDHLHQAPHSLFSTWAKRAPAVAQIPIGPWAKTAAVSPIFRSALSAAEIPVEAMSASRTTCSSVSSSGTGEVTSELR